MVDPETKKVAGPTEVFAVRSRQDDQLVAVAVPIGKRSKFIVLTPGIDEAHVGMFNIVLSTKEGPAQFPFVRKIKQQFASVTFYYRKLSGSLQPTTAAFRAKDTPPGNVVSIFSKRGTDPTPAA